MSPYSKQEIAAVLQAAEILNKKEGGEKINISQFCREAGISRKNAYKHRNNIDTSEQFYKQQLAKLEQENAQLKQQLELAEQRAHEAGIHDQCREFLKQYNLNKKNPERRKELIKSYNKLAVSHGLAPLPFWE
jgi:hypothetical protein